MKIAIMQPYVFPYIGYFQLIKEVDKFIFYDDVNFIKKGWINRNRILSNGTDFMFTIPLENVSQFSKIKDIDIDTVNFIVWKNKFLKTIEINYKKAPYFVEVFKLISEVMDLNGKYSISDLAIKSVIKVLEYLKIETPLILSTTKYDNNHFSGQQRILDICKYEGADHYINPIGGKELYDSDFFKGDNILINFIKTKEIKYNQFKHPFVSGLSVIDVLMFNNKSEINNLLLEFELI
ncbi:WbqC family protein [Taibaiella lutea]|uniref:WbqC family protein n=1 Tax=Taibaiella lutea TaxID=2608001 RepID=A0A5M6CQK4_9BACT|nr:WbqC family protein [Taibaiella lutea]KAA5536252.1 WbqC family protein [Taibaiella lutea]